MLALPAPVVGLVTVPGGPTRLSASAPGFQQQSRVHAPFLMGEEITPQQALRQIPPTTNCTLTIR